MQRTAVVAIIVLLVTHTAAATPLSLRQRPIAESARRYFADHPDALNQGGAPQPIPRSRKAFPAYSVLIGAGVGCGFGLWLGNAVHEDDRADTMAKACVGMAAFGALIGLYVAGR